MSDLRSIDVTVGSGVGGSWYFQAFPYPNSIGWLISYRDFCDGEHWVDFAEVANFNEMMQALLGFLYGDDCNENRICVASDEYDCYEDRALPEDADYSGLDGEVHTFDPTDVDATMKVLKLLNVKWRTTIENYIESVMTPFDQGEE